MTVGRPTDYTQEFCQIAADLCAAGATDFEVAERLGVCVRTIYRWKAEYPEFCQALIAGKEAADDRVERSLYNRAVGYEYSAVKIMQDKGEPVIVPYTEHVPPDVGAATLWLTNRRGDKWRAKQAIEHTGPNGEPIVFAASMASQIAAANNSQDAVTLYQQMVRGETPQPQASAAPPETH